MRVLLTGATGFVGGAVLPRLQGRHEILCLSREPGRVPSGAGVRAVRADLGRTGQWETEVAAFGPEWCLHFAWEGLPDYSLDRCRTNLDASVRLLDVVRRGGVRRVVMAGSCWEYGHVSGAVAEASVPSAPSIFGATKQALLTVLEAVARDAAFEWRWARIFFVYGPGQRRQSLLPQLRAAYAAGRLPDIREPDAMHDFIHIDDVASALVTLASAEAPSGVFNVGTGQPATVAAIANRAADHYGRPRPFVSTVEGRGFWADTGKTSSLTGWSAQVGLDEGIGGTLAALDRLG